MSSGYQIDLGELGSLITTLRDAKDSMDSANNALKDASARDLGTSGLDGAGGDFQDKWGYGIGQIADLSGKMTTGLSDTQKTYQNAEDSISKLFPNPGGSSGGGGSRGGGTGS